MTKETRAKNKRRGPWPFIGRNLVYYLAVACSAAFLVFGISLVLYAYNVSRAETAAYIRTATSQTRYAVDNHISEEFITLQSASVSNRERSLLAADETFHRIAESLLAYNTYVQVGLADTTGQFVWTDRTGEVHRTDVADPGLFWRALQGETVLGQSIYLERYDMRVNYYAVPFLVKGQVVGVLFAADPEDELRKIVNHSLHAGQGLAHLVDRQGNYIVESNSPLSLGIGSSIFEIAEPLDAEFEAEMRLIIADGRAGYLERSVYGGNRYIALEPLETVNWYVFYVVPEHLVTAGLRFVTSGAIAAIVVAVCIFLLFIGIVWQSNARRRTQLERVAFEDPLTGQRNLFKFKRDAATCIHEKPPGSYTVWYCDIRDFSFINDLYGRKIGDGLMRYWATYLAEELAEDELFGRTAADIVAILRRNGTDEELKARFDADAAYIAAYPPLAEKGYHIELIAGVCRVEGKDSAGFVQDLIDRASTTLNRVQRAPGHQLAIFSAEMREQKRWETEMESHMEAGLAHGEFEVYWQPKVDIQDGNRLMGMETLVRWNFPGHGMLPPGEFIPLFERNGFIVKLDRYCFEESCRQFAQHFLRPHGGAPALVMSVNVSRLGLLQGDFVETYTAAKERYGIPDGCVELELTESLVFERHASLLAINRSLHRRGFLCSLDDFGSGYSSLNLLQSLEVDVLKLDRLFFRFDGPGERGAKLVGSIIRMAQSLKMKTVAEGVEDIHMVHMLRRMGCDAVQGYVFAKPMPAADFVPFAEAWMQQNPGA